MSRTSDNGETTVADLQAKVAELEAKLLASKRTVSAETRAKQSQAMRDGYASGRIKKHVYTDAERATMAEKARQANLGREHSMKGKTFDHIPDMGDRIRAGQQRSLQAKHEKAVQEITALAKYALEHGLDVDTYVQQALASPASVDLD